MTPATEFRPAGPRFRLLFGETAASDAELSRPPVAADLFGWGVIYALHAGACIERGRLWQAEHYAGAVRDHALALACLREGRQAVQARGHDDLSAETLARFEDAHVGALEPDAFGRPSPHPLVRSCAKGSRGVFPTRTSSPSASRSSPTKSS